MPIDKELLKNTVAALASPEDAALERFDLYARLLTEKNKVMNLTALTTSGGLCSNTLRQRLVAERVVAQRRVNGCGCGYRRGIAGVALLILNPSISLTLMDSTKKKLDFLAKRWRNSD